MIYLLALIGGLTVAVLLWRAFGAERVGVSSHPAQIAPDDDPDFLRKLGEQQRKRRDETDPK
jgi:hypothetical protein